MSDNDLIRRGDALASVNVALFSATGDLYDAYFAIAALPAVTVGVKPLVWLEDFADHPFGWYETIDCGDCIVLTQSGVTLGSFPILDAAKAAAQADYAARILAALTPTPAPDAAAIREAALREAADLVNRRVDGVRVTIPCPDGKLGCLVHHFRIEDGPTAKAILALITEKPHDRA